jgi:hypothetical protein
VGGKKGKERKRDIKGKEVRQPLGNHLATKRQPADPCLAYRNPIGRLDRVCKRTSGAVRKAAKKKAQE